MSRPHQQFSSKTGFSAEIAPITEVSCLFLIRMKHTGRHHLDPIPKWGIGKLHEKRNKEITGYLHLEGVSSVVEMQRRKRCIDWPVRDSHVHAESRQDLLSNVRRTGEDPGPAGQGPGYCHLGQGSVFHAKYERHAHIAVVVVVDLSETQIKSIAAGVKLTGEHALDQPAGGV
ncbi:uncharacterized protein ATNIH1004_000379 [Aspergillus tanneri]|uniref:Uncharacterized protein n=1 Tax=Aspergillus tanneri TaxID=1220188 RepID=A0A5M9MWI7_9EURO|nr:uncharacterized protein ATNIH1004_000379 [Aspergillus tanneri]KAA8651491.1 hypothetical protein ATNIH1004_000379 [Aspergillus tanneri]